MGEVKAHGLILGRGQLHVICIGRLPGASGALMLGNRSANTPRCPARRCFAWFFTASRDCYLKKCSNTFAKNNYPGAYSGTYASSFC